MTTQPVPSAGDPRHLLAATRDLARRVRREQRGAWFPLLVFALVTFAATPVGRYGMPSHLHCVPVRSGHVCTGPSALATWYWPVALLLAYAAISWFYIRRSGKLGVGTRVRPYLVVGVVLTVLTTAFELWYGAHPAIIMDVPGPLRPLLGAAGVIGLALLVLAWTERSWALLAITCAYFLTHYQSSNIRVQAGTEPSPWAFLPHLLLTGGVLLLGGVVLALVQRAQVRSDA